VFNRKASDIDYLYCFQWAGKAALVDDSTSIQQNRAEPGFP
jgi:hypothetical protein